MHHNRRQWVAGGISAWGAALLGGFAPGALAQPGPKKLAPKLRLVIPAISRASLDNTGRALGDALVVGGLCDEIEYENIDAKGGSQALAVFADKHGRDPNSLLMLDSSVVGATALLKAPIDVTRLQPLARLITDTPVVVVPAGSAIKTPAELVDKLKAGPKQLPLGVGPSGSVDHLLAGLLVKAAGGNPEELTVQHFARSFELVDAVVAGKVAAGISAYGVFNAELASKRLRALGVTSRRGAYGVRSLREQGVDVDLTNWRTVFTGQGVPPARAAELVDGIKVATADDSWKKGLKQNFWEPAWLAGPDLAGFLDIDTKTTQLILQLLKLKA